MKTKDIVGIVVIIVLLIAAAVSYYAAAGARYDRDVAEANLRAFSDTVRIFRAEAEEADGRATVAATRLQQQQQIDSDSIRDLNNALGAAARRLELRTRALAEAQVEFERVQASLDTAMVELTNVRNPQGREERVAAFQEETDLIEADIVVAVPWDTAQGIEVELVAQVKPFDLTYALGCTPANDAVVTFQAPDGITARPRMGTVDPEVCFGERPSLGSGFKVSFGNMALGGAIGLLAGLLIGS